MGRARGSASRRACASARLRERASAALPARLRGVELSGAMVLLESEQVGPRRVPHGRGCGAQRSGLRPVTGRARRPRAGRGGRRPGGTPGCARPGPRLVGAARAAPGERAGGGIRSQAVWCVLVLQFLTELTRLFQKCRTSGSVFITLKKCKCSVWRRREEVPV